MTDQNSSIDLATTRIREIAESYTELARAIEDAVRPDGAGRPIDRLRRLLETTGGTEIDKLRPFQSDAVAGAASCYLRLVARVAGRACEAAENADPVATAAASFLITSLSSEILGRIHDAEQALDRLSETE